MGVVVMTVLAKMVPAPNTNAGKATKATRQSKMAWEFIGALEVEVARRKKSNNQQTKNPPQLHDYNHNQMEESRNNWLLDKTTAEVERLETTPNGRREE
jgi:hypothetical protein